jgi:hypothetical protein
MVLLAEEYIHCVLRTEYLNVIRVNLSLQMVNTSLSSRVATSEMIDVVPMVMKVEQRARNRE